MKKRLLTAAVCLVLLGATLWFGLRPDPMKQQRAAAEQCARQLQAIPPHQLEYTLISQPLNDETPQTLGSPGRCAVAGAQTVPGDNAAVTAAVGQLVDSMQLTGATRADTLTPGTPPARLCLYAGGAAQGESFFLKPGGLTQVKRQKKEYLVTEYAVDAAASTFLLEAVGMGQILPG